MIRFFLALVVLGGLAWVVPAWWRRQALKQRSAPPRPDTPAPEADPAVTPPVYTDAPSPGQTAQAATDWSIMATGAQSPDTDDTDTTGAAPERTEGTKADDSATDQPERVRVAISSGDPAMMEEVLVDTTDAVLRHRLLTQIVAIHYRLRDRPAHRPAFYRFGQQQIEEASSILDAIQKSGQPRPGHIDAFKMVAIAMDEDSRYQEAIAICKAARVLDLEDGTKTGFEGRIARLERKLNPRPR